jgi:phosphoglycerol transferase MdoB-like AlkP superfamily enzyme
MTATNQVDLATAGRRMTKFLVGLTAVMLAVPLFNMVLIPFTYACFFFKESIMGVKRSSTLPFIAGMGLVHSALPLAIPAMSPDQPILWVVASVASFVLSLVNWNIYRNISRI